MKNWLLIFVFILISTRNIYGQSPYELKSQNESIYLGVGVISAGSGAWLSHKAKGLTLEDLAEIKVESVNELDRLAIQYNSIEADNYSDAIIIGSHALPALLMTNKAIRKDAGKIALLYVEMYSITAGITFIVKSTALRPRPFVHNELVNEASKLEPHARFSFFSGHTSGTAANCFFTAKVFSDYFPDSKLKPYVWGLAATIPAVTGYFRVKAGKHYPTDVLFGYGIGAVVGVLIPHVHKRKGLKKQTPISIYPTLEGAGLIWQF